METIKKGTKLIAIDSCVMHDTKIAALTIGKEYEVLKVSNSTKEFWIKSELFDEHCFDFLDFDDFFKLAEEAQKESGDKYYEIDFEGSLLTQIKVSDSKIEIIRSVNGGGYA